MCNKKNESKELMVIEQSKMVNMPSSAIHIENNITLLQKKLWFEMVYKALPSMGQKRTHTISLDDLRHLLGYEDSTDNYKELKKALVGLTKISVDWNIFGKDKKNNWECFSLLAGARIPKNQGVCYYDFSIFLEERFLAMGQEAYAKIDLIISKKFQSKYSLSLYCLAIDYLIIRNGYSEKSFTLEEIRKYLGIEKHEYPLTGNLNDRIIIPAEKEINEISDINIEIKPMKLGRKIIGYKLCMSLKEGRLDNYISKSNRFKELIEKHKKELELEKENNYVQDISTKKPQILQIEPIKKRELIIPESEEINKFLNEHKISITTDTVQKKLLELKDTIKNNKLDEYLLFLIRYIKKENIKISFKNISGFFITLLKDDSQIYNYYFELSEKEKKDAIIQQKKLIRIEELIKEKVFNKYNENIKNGFENHLRKNIDMLENTLIDVIKDNIKPNTFIYDLVIMKDNKGIINKSLILDLKIGAVKILISELEKYSDRFLYKKPDFEAWKNENIDKETLKKIRFEVENSLN